MTLQVSQSVNPPSAGTLTTPTALTPAASDTISQDSFGANGLLLVLISTGTQCDITVADPTLTDMNYAGTVPTLTGVASGTRVVFIPRQAVNTSTGVATVTFSGARTGVTYYLLKV